MGIFSKLRSLFVKEKHEDPLFEQKDVEKQDWQEPFNRTEDIPEEVKNISEEEQVKETARDKARDFTEKVGEDVIDKADELYDQGKEKFSELADKAKKNAERLKEKAQDTYDDLYEKAKEQKEIDENTPEYGEESHADKLRKTDLMEGTDDFFSKAEKFAEGDYKAAREGKVDVRENESKQNSPKKDDRKVAGFEDRDGDGDELIDDAEIEDEEQ
ncbi:MAG TPA: hypothetical protein VJ917_01395 [Saprospiraceae bacterium]|nr:hypothetical protein [Saprospiraceae bacterium]